MDTTLNPATRKKYTTTNMKNNIGTIEKRPIEVGFENKNLTLILSGLSEEDYIVTDGQTFVSKGEKVTF